jgi:predicted Fe-S protein YdhL (DUF1289 family)
MSFFQPPVAPILSPCIGVCRLGADGLCEGCHRTVDEIAHWTAYTHEQRVRLMNDVLPRRAEAHPS